jgi:hypothetical protein
MNEDDGVGLERVGNEDDEAGSGIKMMKRR